MKSKDQEIDETPTREEGRKWQVCVGGKKSTRDCHARFNSKTRPKKKKKNMKSNIKLVNPVLRYLFGYKSEDRHVRHDRIKIG